VTFHDCASDAARRIAAAGVEREEAERDAAALLRHHLEWDMARWLAHRHDAAAATLADAVAPLVTRRVAREPMSYVTGTREFWGRPFSVTREALIPRWETEQLVESALARRPVTPGTSARLADIGTGSGCVAVTLALEWPEADIWATDVSRGALALAHQNAERHEVTDRVAFGQGELLAGRPGPFDLIVSNPPYVPEADRASLAPEVVDYEPPEALFAGPDGLLVIAQVLDTAPAALAPGGYLLLEIGHGQADAVKRLVDSTDTLRFVDLEPDLQGIPRILVTTRSMTAGGPLQP
jgi:release factor glutamine methyltransferase